MEIWTFDSANKFIKNYYKKNKHSKDDNKSFINALKFLDEKYESKEAANNLGNIYYDGSIAEQDFKKAEKYYLKAEERGFIPACLNLGYINYYGRVSGKQDYMKAFLYFSKASISSEENYGNVVSNAVYKLADMYYNGYFVKQDKKYAYAIVYNLVPLENFRSGCGDLSCIGDLLSRLARYNLKENTTKYDRYLFYKYTTLSLACINERNNNFWGDEAIIKKLKINLETYKNENKSSFDYYNYSINKPMKDDITTFINIYNSFEGMSTPISVTPSKDKDSIYLTLLCFNQFLSIPEINYANRIETIIIKFNNTTSNRNGLIKFLPEKYELEKEGDDLVFSLNDERSLRLTTNKNSSFKIVEISYKPIKGKDNIILRSDDYDDVDLNNKSMLDA